MTDDARERFLREITAQVPADRIAEVHLFRPMRRGGTETGVAVIAVEQADSARADSAAREAGVPAEGVAGGETVVGGPPDDAPVDRPVDTGVKTGVKTGVNAPVNAPVDATVDAPVITADAPSRPERHTVFTARYRLTRKGAERGKWEFEVVADADAPLGTVDTVVRGVQRRAGDDEEPERLTAEGVRAALDGQAWQRTT